jgi:hypothetical protein
MMKDLWSLNKTVSSKEFWDKELKKQERENKKLAQRTADKLARAKATIERRKQQAQARIERRKAQRETKG